MLNQAKLCSVNSDTVEWVLERGDKVDWERTRGCLTSGDPVD